MKNLVWRDVKKELPEKFTDCLIYNIISELGTGEICWCFYNSSGQWAGQDGFFENVIAWMPLPDPPNFSQNNNEYQECIDKWFEAGMYTEKEIQEKFKKILTLTWFEKIQIKILIKFDKLMSKLKNK